MAQSVAMKLPRRYAKTHLPRWTLIQLSPLLMALQHSVINAEKKPRLNARRSLYALGKLERLTKISEKNIIPKRPGGGISPLFYKKLIGKKLRKKVDDEHKFSWKDFY